MIHYLLDYACFALGFLLFVLRKIKDYKALAKSNPDPKVIYDTSHFINDELINFIMIAIGGIALVIFTPMLTGGASVDVKNTNGAVIVNLEIKTILMPLYFFIGLSGHLFAFFSKYEKTLLNGIGVDDQKNT